MILFDIEDQRYGRKKRMEAVGIFTGFRYEITGRSYAEIAANIL
jgi:hypothetical protein